MAPQPYSHWHSVLIETYWNVKVFITGKTIFKKYVLIETYWNVKMPGLRDMRENSGSINRNILECKDALTTRNQKRIEVLIETYWNVKDCTAE